MENFNMILIHGVVFKCFLGKNNRKGVKIKIYNFNYSKTSLPIKYSQLIKIFEPYGFGKDVLHFDNIKDDDKVWIRVDTISSKKYLDFLTTKFPTISNQTNYFNINYCYYPMGGGYNLFRDDENFCQLQYTSGYFTHNTNGYCYYRFKLDDGEPHDEYREFFNKKYFLSLKREGLLYIGGAKLVTTLHFSEWSEGVKTYEFKPANKELNKIFRRMKISTILEL